MLGYFSLVLVDQGYLRCSAEVTNLQVKLGLRRKLQQPIRK